MSALVRITTGIMPQHSRVGMTRAMAQFGEVIHCHKPPYSGIPGEDFVNVRFASQEAADRAYAALKASQVFVDGFPVGVGPTGGPKGNDGIAAALGSDGYLQLWWWWWPAQAAPKSEPAAYLWAKPCTEPDAAQPGSAPPGPKPATTAQEES
ncbi:unnamed protein product [Effrenium voratum]|nr:unnamed protein product [Effrenium voratum]CAJ1456042.1 unnamed protein product [Effrenium voratum]